MACAPLEIYSTAAHHIGLRSLRNRFVMLSLSTVLDSSRACRLKMEKNRAGGVRSVQSSSVDVPDDDAADGECFPEDILGDYLNSGESTSMCPISPSPLSFAIGGRSPGFFRVGAGVISSELFPHGFPCTFSDRSEGVAKSSLLPRIRVVPCRKTTMVIAVRFLTCLARTLMTLSRSADFFSKVENIFWTSSNAAVLRSSADMFD
ncbi:hypothetical protein F2Q70_00038791 [Brassica cretica]|uniref:Uncharacterized protein n=1 Tax=Brassica cretica TaxID=69181 RepID=A0A8S9K7N2_BRACR|nr:hypothetical protein F2Q70_00038791 [Brassica cretica]